MTYLSPVREDSEGARLAPWGAGPRRLWSLWHMLTLDGARYNQLVHLFYSTEMMARGRTGTLPQQMWKSLDDGALEIEQHCLALELTVSALTARNMIYGCRDSQSLHAALVQITNTFLLEMKNRTFFGIHQGFAKYYASQALFGSEVFSRFPSANDDIFEAGCCLALERPTACVMHLMRVTEAGLSALAAALNVVKQNDWGGYLRKIESELDARAKKSGARTEDEQFFAETAASFDRIRRAWRNPTMHVDRSYSQDRAEEIMLSVKSFMVLLSERLKEPAT